MAIFAPMFSKFDYKTQNIRHTKVPPKMPIVSSLGIMDGKNSDGVDVYEEKGIEETYLFGTDALGRDIWTRTWTGARVSLFIALLAAVFDLLIGVTYGGVSAYYGGSRYYHAAYYRNNFRCTKPCCCYTVYNGV